MTPEAVAVALILAIIAAVLGFVIGRARSTREIAALQMQADQLREHGSRLQNELGIADNRLQEVGVQLHEREKVLAVRDSELKAALSRSEDATAQLSATRRQLQETQTHLSGVEQTVAELKTRVAAEERRSAELSQQRDQLKAELEQQRGKTAAAEQQGGKLNEALAGAQSSLQAVQERGLELGEQIAQLKKELENQRQLTAAAEAERNAVSKEHATLKTSLEAKEEHFAEQLRALDEQKGILKKEFENLAHQIFEAKGKAFSAQSTETLASMLSPFKEQLEAFRKRVDEVHTHQAEGQASLRTELNKLHELNQRITDEAANLTRALKGDKKKQGNWGELQVEMILDQSGLRKGHEYEREASFKDEDNNNFRPDFVVHLPEGKHVIIDSKVTLNAYNDYVAAESDEEREAFLKSHVQAVRKHIDDLHRKDYSKLQGINSPDFIFMFMPIEPAFIAAFEHDPGLFNNAFEKHIVVVTPTTLLATLRTIANLWSIERQNQNARILADQAGKVYDKLRVFVEKMDKLGTQLATAQRTYEDARNSLTGSRSLSSTVQRFVDLGVRVKKELPVTVTEASLLDDDTLLGIEHLSDAETDSDTESEEEIA